MMNAERTVFISYRRLVSWPLAKMVFDNLRDNRFDVFMDLESMGSGDFERIILGEISSRAHFIVILEPGALDRAIEEKDWLRLEIAHAISSGRNIVPVTRSFAFDSHHKLPTDIAQLARQNCMPINQRHFEGSMRELREKFLLPARIPPLKPLSAASAKASAAKLDEVAKRSAGLRDSSAKILPVYLVVNVSSSMAGPKLAAANGILPAIADALSKSPILADKVRCGLLDFADDSRLSVRLADVLNPNLTIPTLTTRPGRRYSAAFDKLRTEIEFSVSQLQREGCLVHRPLVWFLTDGPPEEDATAWRSAFRRLTDTPWYPNLVPLGVDGADRTVLNELVFPDSGPKSMRPYTGAALFSASAEVWISDILPEQTS